MSLEVLDILKTGLKRTFSRNGLMLMGAFYVISALSQVVNDSLVAQAGLSNGAGASATPLAVSMGSPAVWGSLLLVVTLANVWLTVGALRHLVNRRFESIRKDHFTENLAIPALNMIAGSIVFTIIVVIGTLFLVVPGIYLLISLLFWSIYVAVEDDNFIDALKNSWELTKDNKIDLFLIGLGVVLISLVASIILGVPNIAIMSASKVAAALFSQIGSAFGTVLGLATLSHTYNQLQ